MTAIRTEMVSIPRQTFDALRDTAVRLVQRTSESKSPATVELGMELESLLLELTQEVAAYDLLVAIWGPGTQPQRPAPAPPAPPAEKSAP